MEQEGSKLKMKRSAEGAEVVVRLDFKEKRAQICVSEWPAYYAKCRKLYGHPKRCSINGGQIVSAWFECPIDRIKFRNLRGHMSTGQKRSFLEALKKQKGA
jgi:hypothetical protein